MNKQRESEGRGLRTLAQNCRCLGSVGVAGSAVSVSRPNITALNMSKAAREVKAPMSPATCTGEAHWFIGDEVSRYRYKRVRVDWGIPSAWPCWRAQLPW